MQVNAGIIKGLNVEQCLFIPLVSGKIRLGWKTVMDGIQQDPLWAEEKQDALEIWPFHRFTRDSLCRNGSYVLLQPILNHSCGKAETVFVRYNLTDTSDIYTSSVCKVLRLYFGIVSGDV